MTTPPTALPNTPPIHKSMHCVGRWIDSMVAGSWVGPHQRPYSRMTVSTAVLTATDAQELAHILPAYQEVADHITALATDSRCWVREVV